MSLRYLPPRNSRRISMWISRKISRGIYEVFEPERPPEDLLREVLRKTVRYLERMPLEKAINRVITEISSKFTDEQTAEIFSYYVSRDLLGLRELHPLIMDPDVEDISYGISGGCRLYVNLSGEWYPTNLTLNRELSEELAFKLAERMRKQLNMSNPRVEGVIKVKGTPIRVHILLNPDGAGGASISMRKFVRSPSLKDLVSEGLLQTEEAAYLELMVKHGMSGLIVGETGAGKTTLLTSLLNEIPANRKVVLIEDSAEISLVGVRNFTRVLVRQGGEPGSRPTLEDLLRDVLRMRPNYIILGEARGRETRMLFQYIRLGGTALTTFHAISCDDAVKRLTSFPLNVNPTSITDLLAIVLMKRVNGRRKVVEVTEPREEGLVRVFSLREGLSLDRSDIFSRIAEREYVDESRIEREYHEILGGFQKE